MQVKEAENDIYYKRTILSVVAHQVDYDKTWVIVLMSQERRCIGEIGTELHHHMYVD